MTSSLLLLIAVIHWANLTAVAASTRKTTLDDTAATGIHAKDFYIAGAESTSGSNFNQSIIYFKLDIVNPGKSTGVYYDNINLTFSYYATEDDIVPLANYAIQGFRQGVDKKTDQKDFVVTTRGMAWQEISNNVPVLSLLPSVSSDVVFRVDLETAVRFRHYIAGIQSKRLQTMAWCEVEVDQMTGKKSSDKAIKLNHMIKHHHSGWLVFGLIILLLATFLSPCLCFLCLWCVAKLLGRTVTEG